MTSFLSTIGRRSSAEMNGEYGLDSVNLTVPASTASAFSTLAKR